MLQAQTIGWLAVLMLVSYSVSGSSGLAQDAGEQAPSAPAPVQDQAFRRGMTIIHPEGLSGIWEAPDDRGGAVGILLMLDTTIPGEAMTLVGTPQKGLNLTTGVYHRSGAVLQFGEATYFVDSERGGNLKFEEGRLILHSSDIDLDLRRVAGDKWSGRFHREGFDTTVTLSRPGSGDRTKRSWLVGTWRIASAHHCLHIAEQAPGQFTGWLDTLYVDEDSIRPPREVIPDHLTEYYGELAKVSLTEKGDASVELHAYSPGCCSATFVASPAEESKAMKGGWAPTPYRPDRPASSVEWRKMPGETCTVPVP